MRYFLIFLAALAAFQYRAHAFADETLIKAKCTVCHSSDRIEAKKRSRGEWKRIVKRMKKYGALLSGDEEKLVVEYLARVYGR
ncbi:MAG: hypothetical protein EPN22_13960 [Nitrospirae bacterium]|nr:MAG: hypothetical protein EPN22_13960 [Nitrospirota bacterium]